MILRINFTKYIIFLKNTVLKINRLQLLLKNYTQIIQNYVISSTQILTEVKKNNKITLGNL